MTDPKFYTSRSAAECYQDCPRYRYNQYFLGGKGLVGVQKSVPLVTGSAVHRGIEHLMSRLRIGEMPNVDIAVQEAVSQYRNDVEAVGFLDKTIKTDRQQEFTYNEQKALTEGLVRAWAIAEMPRIVERYKVIAVEREIEPIEIAPGVWFQSRVDAEMRELVSGDYFNYSIKTSKGWGEREENSYKSDLQGVTEIWAVEQDSLRADNLIDEMVKKLGELDGYSRYPQANIEQIMGYLLKKKLGKKVSGVRFCILIKGVRKKPDYYGNDPDALYITYSPLIRGYKLITPTEVRYSHSWFYPNPENKSGKSAIGKGWEPFNVWESDISIKQWVEMLASGSVQPECGDIIKQQVITPVEYFRAEGEIGEAIEEVKAQEARIKGAVNLVEIAIGQDDQTEYSSLLSRYFPHVRKHCEFHFGGPCEYKALCWKPEVTQDPVGSGLYQIRTPHHEAERGV
jgi:hypothetical protein